MVTIQSQSPAVVKFNVFYKRVIRLRFKRFGLQRESNSVRWISRPALKPLSYRGSKHKICYYKTFISIRVNGFYFAKSQSISAESIMQVGRSFALTAL